MSENKDIQKVENDKDKIEYEKFFVLSWVLVALKVFISRLLSLRLNL